METLTIGKIADRAGVGVDTVRYYEREGLIPEPPRSQAGYRHFPEGTIERLLFIQKAKQLGFSLKEIKELLSLRARPQVNCADVRARAEEKIDIIEQKIHSLEAMKSVLEGLVEACAKKGSSNVCPILKALDAENDPQSNY